MAELNFSPPVIHTYWLMREVSTNSKDLKSYIHIPSIHNTMKLKIIIVFFFKRQVLNEEDTEEL